MEDSPSAPKSKFKREIYPVEPYTGKMRTEMKFVTPPLAEKWLVNNPNIRGLRKSKVQQYKEIIKRGEWREENHQGVAFSGDLPTEDTCSQLNNGQNRLEAIKQLGMEDNTFAGIFLNVTIHEPVSSNAGTDRGLGRSLADSITIPGMDCDGRDSISRKKKRFLVELCKFAYKDPVKGTHHTSTNQPIEKDVQTFYTEKKNKEAANWLWEKCQSKTRDEAEDKKHLLKVGIKVALFELYKKNPREAERIQKELLRSYDGETKVHSLRVSLLTNKIDGGSGSGKSQVNHYRYAVHTFYQYLQKDVKVTKPKAATESELTEWQKDSRYE